MKTFASLLLLTAGCTVMVNGKPRHIGGSDPTPDPTTAAAAPASPAAPGAPAAPEGAPTAPAAPSLPGQILTVDATLTSAPLILAVGAVAFDTTFSKHFGSGGNSPDCGNEMTSRPVASIDVKTPMETLELTVEGGSNDGFVLAHGKSLWFACTSSIGEMPAISRLKEGWQPGRYDIYAVSRYGKGANQPFAVEVADSSKPAPWPAKLKTISLPGKLAQPMFVEVTTQPNRRKLRAARGGWGCEKAAFANEPDLALVLERPIPGLVVRPLPNPTPVIVRRELRDAKRPDKGCPSGSTNEGPSYRPEHEIRFANEDEGTYGISLGTADAGKPTTVTLMIFDKSTKLDALASFPYVAGDSIEQRWLGYQFPQMQLDELEIHRDFTHAELAAKVFALAPKTAFVYAKLDLDKDLAWSGSAEAFPVKNEPLLVIGLNREQIDVLAADGHRYRVKDTHLVLAPDGAAAIPAAPRAMRKLDIGDAMGMLPASGKALALARTKRIAAHEACVDRVWAPYGNQLPTYSHPAGVDIVVVESPGVRRIKEAGNNAVDQQCGTEQAGEKQTEVERVKMVAEIEKARAKLLVQATAAWR